MRALLPVPVRESATVTDLHEHYATDWTDSGGIRANMLASVDGAVSVDGRSRGLQTPADNRVFAALRDLADVVLVGAATALAEGYRPFTPDAERREVRRRFGLRPQLPVALVSRNLGFGSDAPIFADPTVRPLLLTTAAADTAPYAARAEVVVCGDSDLDFGTARRELAARGLTRVLCEGGPRLLAGLLAAGEVDELCLSITPMLAGSGANRIVAGEALPSVQRLGLHTLLEEDGALFARYLVQRG
jgi:riboflavin biosynthesis pyrimidine reductase